MFLRLKMKFRDHTTSLCLAFVLKDAKYLKVQRFHRQSFFCTRRRWSLKFQRHYMGSFNELVSGFPAADVTSSFISCFPSIPAFQLFCVFCLEENDEELGFYSNYCLQADFFQGSFQSVQGCCVWFL